MDHKFYKPNNRLGSYEAIREAFKDSIVNTNRIIRRWIFTQGTAPNRIYDEEIRGVLIGQLKKAVFHDRTIDFRRLNKNMHVSTFLESRCISSITITSIDIYWNDKAFVEDLVKVIGSFDYIALANRVNDKPDEVVEEPQSSNTPSIRSINVVDWDKLNSIKL